ncbi:MAG: signal recognition particle-docking protein FtsY [Candidatus Aenigmatarchaeota archaeon]
MFDSLKKRLKEVFKKATAIVEKPEEIREEKKEIKEEAIEEKVEKYKEIEEKEERVKEFEEVEGKEEITATEEKDDDLIAEVEKEVVKEELPEEFAAKEKEIEEEIPKIKKELAELEDDVGIEKEKNIEIVEAELAVLKPKLEFEKELKEEPIGKKEREEEIKVEIREEKKEKKGLFSRLLPGIVKKVTEKKLSVGDVDTILNELKTALLENDVAFAVAEKICNDVKSDLVDKSVKRGSVEEIIKASLHSAMLDVMSQEKIDLEKMIEKKQPFTIIFLGFNGTGKTTTMAKLAHKFKKHKPVIAAADTFRAASIEQLEEHASRLKVDLVKHKYGSDSAAVIFDAKKHAEAVGAGIVLADTAGRSHANANLMDELKKICKVNNPDMKILVLDSLTGNDIYEQSRLFNDAVGVDGIILTKADVYEKGGAALSASYTIKKPILYLGVGQNYDDLKEFNPQDIADKLLK